MGIVAEDKPGSRDNEHSSWMTTVAVHSQHCSKYAAPDAQESDPWEEVVAFYQQFANIQPALILK